MRVITYKLLHKTRADESMLIKQMNRLINEKGGKALPCDRMPTNK